MSQKSLVESESNTSNVVTPYGESIVSGGLYVRGVLNGFGLTGDGLLWQLYDIWFDTEYYKSISTTWTDVQFGVWGEAPPSQQR